MAAIPIPGVARCQPIVIALVVVAGLAWLLPSRLVAAEPSAVPLTSIAPASPTSTMAPVEAMCESAADLRLIIAFLRDTDVSEDGWLPVFVGTIAALSEARQLAGSVDQTYRPLLDDLIGTLEGLRSTIADLDELETVGSQLAVIGEAITDIGLAMDALSVQLRTPCPMGAPESAPTATG
jgi:hypothetical protein